MIDRILALLGMLVLIIAVHEAGHALAGVLLRLRVISVSVGDGPVLLERHARGITYRLSLIPTRGLVTFEQPSAPGKRSVRVAVLAAAGPSANVLLSALMLTGWFGSDLFAAGLFYTSAMIALLNLVPFRSRGFRTDGLLIFRSLWPAPAQHPRWTDYL